MAKALKLKETLALLNQIEPDSNTEEAIALLGQVLRSKHAIAVARAAKQVGKAQIRLLVPNLVAAFDRFMINPIATDPNCLAKKEIAEALYRLDSHQEDLFLTGIRHVQMEPIWGGKTDTASGLRGCCAMGLVRMNYPEVMAELADLLADPEPPARIAAARAIAYSGSSQGVPLLRLKVRVGDKDPQVMAECFAALLQLAPTQSLALIASFLNQPDEAIAEMAALALGESHIPEVFPVLHHCWQHTRYENLKRTALLAIAMLRHDEALQFLLSLVAKGKPDESQEAIAVLGIYKQDTVLWQQVCDAAQKRRDVADSSNSD